MNEWINQSAELAECAMMWRENADFGCFGLEDILYTQSATVPTFQRLSIFVPRAYLTAEGRLNRNGRCGNYTATSAPIIFENNAAGYMQMPHTWLGGPRNYARAYLEHGMVYVTCGCRGRESVDAKGECCGKAPITLVDLKTAIRFLQHNRSVLPGNWERMVSVGWSAGGAMSALLAVTGDHPAYEPYLRENGAFLEESDSVFAAQIYCPIIDLEHADIAYEWMFRADKRCEDSPCGPAETMSPFQESLSAALSRRYSDYINGLALRHPEADVPLKLTADGRGGTFYQLLMSVLDASATKHFARMPSPKEITDYLAGSIEREVSVFERPVLAPGERPKGLGELMCRPPEGVPFREHAAKTIRVPGTDKRDWLAWDGCTAHIKDLDTYVLKHRRRMKPCTAFDKLQADSGENQLFGTQAKDSVHFSCDVAEAVEMLCGKAPQGETKKGDFAGVHDEALQKRIALLNPLHFIAADVPCAHAAHYRIRVGASDADTSLSVSMVLALKLQNENFGTVDYALVWDEPHSEADYPGEVLEWIDGLCKE